MSAYTPFLREKFGFLFTQYYDINKNGIVNHADFADMTKDLQKFRRWPADDDRLKVCQQTLRKAWTNLKSSADANKDEKITIEEWHSYWSKFVQEQTQDGAKEKWTEKHEWIDDYLNFWFDLLDTSGDAFVDVNEFVQVCKHFGIHERECVEAFENLKCKAIDRSKYFKLCQEYFTSDNPKDPGNNIFGKASWNKCS